MEIKAKMLLNFNDVVSTLQKIYNCENFNAISAYRMKKMCDGITTHMKKLSEELNDINKNSKDEEKKEKLDALVAKTLEVKFGPIKSEEFECLQGLSPMDLTILEQITDPSVFSALEA